MNVRRTAVLVAAIIVVLIAGIYVATNRHPSTSSGQLTTVVLAQNTVPLSSLTIIAAREGYFEKHGLNVEVKPFQSGKLALDAVLGGGADIATVAETPLARAQLAGIPVSVIAQIASSSDDIKVAYNTTFDIRTPADLKGKTIATAVGTSAEYFTDQFLAKYGLTPGDVNIINLAPAQMVQALQSGSIAAFSIFEPYPHLALSALGSKAAIFDVPGLYTETFNLAVKPQYLKSNSATLEKFLLAILDAQNFASISPAQAMDIVSGVTSSDRHQLELVWPQFDFRVSDPQAIAQVVSQEQSWIAKSAPPSSGPPLTPQPILDSSIYKSIVH